VVAPDGERSGNSHALSLHRPLRISQVQPRWFQVSGTPVDCVFMAFHSLMKETPFMSRPTLQYACSTSNTQV